jgi:hypothetical protein
VTDNGDNQGFFSVTCIEGCSFSASGPLSSGGRLAVAGVN